MLEDLVRWHELTLRYTAGDTSVKQARDWLEVQVWREVEVLVQVEAGRAQGPIRE